VITVSPTTNTTYTVTVTDANGCTANASVTVSVNALPVAVASPDADICAGASTSLSASGGTSYSWSPTGSTSATISVSPVSNSTYIVTVTDGNGCSNMDSVTVNVHAAPVVNLQSFFLCSGSNATLDAGNPGSTYLWSPSGATTQIININSGGSYQVTVTNPYGCSTTSSVNIAAGASLTVTLGSISFCQGDSAVLDAGHPGMLYQWTPSGATTQTIVIHAAGTYGVTVTDTSGFSGAISATAVVNPIPSANFAATNICVGNATSFTDASSVSSGTIATWSWNFGDGSSSSQQNPSHTYSTAGTYSVTLTITTVSGCTNTVTNSVIVNPLPLADFNFVNACENSAVAFTDNSIVSSGNITGYLWDFGDGATSSSQNPNHLYAGPGNYSVTLQVTTAGGCSNSIIKTVTVFPLPVVDFTAVTVCLGSQTVFINGSTISTGSIVSYAWDFGDSYTSTTHHPNHVYTNPGTYQVSLTIVSNKGCTATLIKPVTVHALPVADAGINQSICFGSSATLTATGGSSYSWSPAGLNTAVINVSPSSNTTYTVTVTDTNGCSSSSNVTVSVNPLPVANAGPDKSICAGASVTLNATGGLSYSWNPTGSTNSSINVSPVSTTDYVVLITDANGCQQQDTVRVAVHALPVVSAGPDQTICVGSTISITATGATSYSWNPGGSTSASILSTPASGMNYIVTGTDAFGCQAIDTMHVTVNTSPIVNMPATFVCAGFSTTLNAGNPGSTYSWSTGDNTQTITVTDSGSYMVFVTNATGCTTQGSVHVSQAGGFITNPSNTSACTGQSVTLDAGNPGCTYLWNTGATSQTIVVSNAATYSVVVTDANGCSATINSNVNIYPNPVVTFSAPAACFGMTNSFTDQSTITSGTIQVYSWDFGDGFSSSLRNPTHKYLQTGTYTVSLTVTSSNGCSGTVSKPVTVNPVPSADFSNTTVCRNQSTSFTNLSSVTGGSITSWSWSFGDGSNSSIQNPSHVYMISGNINVGLIVTSSNGCSDTIFKNINVKGLPVAAFSAPNVCAETPVQLSNTSYSMNGTIATTQWNFGNGSSSSANNPAATYTVDGSFTIQLIVTSSIGCSDTSLQTVTIYPLPVANFATSPVCQNTAAAFVNNSTIASGSVSSVYWNFGDGSGSGLGNPTHLFANNGTYTINLVATSDHQCRDTVSQTLQIHPLPIAHFSAPDVCVNAIVSLQDSSTISSGNVTSWSWDFGDNTASPIQSPAHIYATAGTYNVALTVTSAFGCTNTYHSNVNIFPDPVAAFAGANVCYSNATQFFNQSYVTGGSSFTSLWSYNDGTSSIAGNPSHIFNNAGTYNVTLTVTSSHGCTNQVTHTLNVYAPPNALFSATNGCLGTQTAFIDSSTSANGTISSWHWEFGDGNVSNSSTPVHGYIQDGNYNVTLTVTTNYGCFDNTTGVVSIFPVPTPVIQSADACIGTPISFADVSANAFSNIGYAWDLGDGTFSADSTVSHLFYSPGVYTVMLTTTNNFHCNSSDRTTLRVYPKPEIEFHTQNTCMPDATPFSNTSTIGYGTMQSYHWNFGDGASSALVNPTHTYSNTGIYTVILTGVSDFGCTNSDTMLAKVNPSPQINFGSAISGCSPLLATFTDSTWISDGSIAGWLWDFGDGGVSTSEHPSYTYLQSGNYNVTVTVVSNEGCQATANHPGYVTVFTGPDAAFDVNPPVTDIINPVIQFTNLSQNYSSFQWIFGDGASTSTVISPMHAFADTGTYSALLITVSNNGCRDTAFRTIEVRPHSTLFAPNCFTPNGDGRNDVFKPAFTQMQNIQVWIYNRWGELLKSWDSLEGYWDGYYNGTPCQEDVYVYKIKGLGLDGKDYEWIGHVSIVH